MKCRTSKMKLFCETSFKNDMLTRCSASELQYVLACFSNSQVDASKVLPRQNSAEAYEVNCNCHAKWSLQSNISGNQNLQPFHRFSVPHLKHQPHKTQNPCACHAKSIVADPLEIHHICQRFLQPSQTPARATHFATRQIHSNSLRLPRETPFEHI